MIVKNVVRNTVLCKGFAKSSSVYIHPNFDFKNL